MPNSVTTIYEFSPTGRHETIRITEGDSELIYNLSSYKSQIYVLIVRKLSDVFPSLNFLLVYRF